MNNKLRVQIPEYHDLREYETNFNTYHPDMLNGIQNTMLTMCHDAMDKLKTKLIEINDTYNVEIHHNSKTHDMTHRIMCIYNSFSRVNELLERIKFRFYFQHCDSNEKRLLKEYIREYIHSSDYVNYYIYYITHPQLRIKNEKVQTSCQKMYLLIQEKMHDLITRS